MAQSKPKSRFVLALLFLFCVASVATASTESIKTVHKSDELDSGTTNFAVSTENEEGAASTRELFWVNNKHLPEWQDFKFQQRIQRRRRRRRRNKNGPFKKPNRWNGTGFRMHTKNNRMNMNMNMMGMNMMNMKKRMKPRKMMMTNTNLNFQPIMTRGMMKMRPMRANTWSSDEERSNSKRRMELTWEELTERRMNMRKRANRRFKRRQWRMQQRRNERNEREESSDEYIESNSGSSSSSRSSSSR